MVAGASKTVVTFDQKAMRALERLTRAVEGAQRLETRLAQNQERTDEDVLNKVHVTMVQAGVHDPTHTITMLQEAGITFQLKES